MIHIPFEIYICMFHYNTTSDCKHHLKKPIILGDFRKLEHKESDKANKTTCLFDAAFSMKMNECPKLKNLFKSHVALNKLHIFHAKS